MLKCNDEGCSRHLHCKRFTEPPAPESWYFTASPRWNGQECDFHIHSGAKPLTAFIEELHEQAVERLNDNKI